MLNGKRGLHLVVLYIVIGDRRIPWSYIAAYYGFDIVIKPRPDKAYQEWCKI